MTVTDLDALKKSLNVQLKLGRQSAKNGDDIGAARINDIREISVNGLKFKNLMGKRIVDCGYGIKIQLPTGNTLLLRPVGQ